MLSNLEISLIYNAEMAPASDNSYDVTLLGTLLELLGFMEYSNSNELSENQGSKKFEIIIEQRGMSNVLPNIEFCSGQTFDGLFFSSME